MIISRVSLFNTTLKDYWSQNNNIGLCATNNKIKLQHQTSTLNSSAILQFGAAIKSPGEFKALTKTHAIHCPYCKRIMLYGGTLEKFLKSGLFDMPAKFVTEILKPYKKTFRGGHKMVYSMINNFAIKNPKMGLDEIIQTMYSHSLKKLRKSQTEVFKELITAASDLPQELNGPFRKFMKNQHKKLNGIPCQQDFSGKTYSYKLYKMLQTVSTRETKTRLIEIAEILSSPMFKDLSAEIPIDVLNKVTKGKTIKDGTANSLIKYILDEVQNYGQSINRKDIVNLCITSRKMLNEQPVVVPFSNKEFMHDLVKTQLLPIKNTPLYTKIISIAQKLPNSETNVNSFIVKHKYADSKTIGYKLLEPGITTIEHIKPRSENGVDALKNMALACKADNNERQSISQVVYLKKWPNKNPQIYFNDIIKISNKESLILPSDIVEMSRSFFEEGNVKIDLSRLKHYGVLNESL